MRCRVSAVLVLLASLGCVVLTGCSGGATVSSGNGGGTTAAAAAVISSVSPSAVTAGSGDTTLTVSGSNFVQGSEIALNGTPRPTLYVSSTSLQSQLLTKDLSNSTTLQVTVVNPGAVPASNGLPVVVASGTPSPLPTVSAISPQSAPTGSPQTTLTVTGTGFVPSSTVLWNGSGLATTFQSASALLAQIPASLLQTAGSASVTVSTAAPGGGVSGSSVFAIVATGTTQQITLNVTANDLVWDPVNQKIYLSIPSAAGVQGNSVQTLDPVTGTTGSAVFAGSEPNLLAVSSKSKYLYVALDGGTAVQRFNLPAMTSDIKLGLGSDSFYGPFAAEDLQSSPANDGSVAIVRGTSGVSPSEEGGVIIYDDGLIRPNPLCGFIQSGCNGGGLGALYNSIQWNADGTTMYAANNEDTGFDFYVIPVSSTGFGKVKDFGGLAGGFGSRIHFDATTGYVYDDNGSIIDPVAGAPVGVFGSRGLMVPDGKNNTAYFLSTNGSSALLQSYDMTHFTPLDTMQIANVVGAPTHLIRWGTNGLAFTTINTNYGSATPTKTGAVYVISGPFVR